MVDVDKLSDAELRTKLIEFGFPVMPITGTTRKVMAKKLKMLLENKNRIDSGYEGGRKSLGRYSSEEDSDIEAKILKKKDNRRVTMGAPSMQPPTTSRSRKSTRLNATPESDVVLVSDSPGKREIRTTNITSMTRSKKIIKNAQDEFDTGSESESDIVKSYTKSYDNARRTSPAKSSSLSSKYSSPKSADTIENSYSPTKSYASPSTRATLSSYHSPTSASEFASDRLDQIRSRLSLGSPSYDKSLYSPPPLVNLDKEDTPFLSNFTRRLSALSSQRNESDYKNDIIKEHDTNGTSSYTRSYLNRPTRGRETTYDYKTQNSGLLKSNYVSFAVLAGTALFFVFLAIVYLGMRSDTTVVPSGYNVPYCVKNEQTSKKGINCLYEEDIENAINLLSVLLPELKKKAVANKCYDSTIKSHMTEDEIVTFCTTNFAIKDGHKIRSDLRNLEILTFNNPEWGVYVAQKEGNNGGLTEEDITKDMEQVIFNKEYKVTSLIVLNPDLPWRCTFYNTFYMFSKMALFTGAIFMFLYLMNLGYKYYIHFEQKRKDEIGLMVEKIVDLLQSSEDSFLVINHVRDTILPVEDRKNHERTWEKAVNFIKENESRVRTEIQVVQGEPFEVWRWIGSANLSMTGSPKNKSWQGQAFETEVGSVNSLPCSPTPCLKIRGMVEDGDRNMHMIREAVLSKCAHQCKILHCAVDSNTNCVYLKCADPNEAAIAYRNLHGWWYARHLVTVKYIRLERYMQRFPNSPSSGSFLKAVTSATDWSV